MLPLIERHTNHLTLAGYRPRTIEQRSSVLAAFSVILDKPLLKATRDDIEAFLARPITAQSRRAYRSHLRGFYLWAVDEHLIKTDPTAKIPPIRVPRGQPRPIGDADLALALATAPPRTRAWLLLMALSGLRCMEVAALRPGNLTDSAAGPLLFLPECKGGGTAVMPAHPEVAAALTALPVRNRLWWSCSPKQVSRIVRDHLHGLGIDATAHQLRHFAGTAWYRESGHDLLTTATLLRHQSTDTTRVYAQLDPQRPAQVVGLVGLPTAV